MIKYILTTLLIVNASFALDLNSLLQNVKDSSNKEIIEEQKRLKDFIDNKNRQKELLIKTKKS